MRQNGNYFNYCSKIFTNFSKGKSIGHGSTNSDILTGTLIRCSDIVEKFIEDKAASGKSSIKFSLKALKVKI